MALQFPVHLLPAERIHAEVAAAWSISRILRDANDERVPLGDAEADAEWQAHFLCMLRPWLRLRRLR